MSDCRTFLAFIAVMYIVILISDFRYDIYNFYKGPIGDLNAITGLLSLIIVSGLLEQIKNMYELVRVTMASKKHQVPKQIIIILICSSFCIFNYVISFWPITISTSLCYLAFLMVLHVFIKPFPFDQDEWLTVRFNNDDGTRIRSVTGYIKRYDYEKFIIETTDGMKYSIDWDDIHEFQYVR